MTAVCLIFILNVFALVALNEPKDAFEILTWVSAFGESYMDMGWGKQPFVRNRCSYQNCFITNMSSNPNKNDTTNFDALLFNIPDLAMKLTKTLPRLRSSHQKYILHSWDSPFPLPSEYDGYFNWTFTYKLDSDILWPFMVITDKKKTVRGPRKNMKWISIDDMEPIKEDVISKLNKKNKAVAWFVSDCTAANGRLDFVKELSDKLKMYGHQVHIYGECGNMTCPKHSKKCGKLIQSDYFFYLAFENNFSEDYVSEKILTALKNFAVPIVYGGANYNWFMPDGIYLDACALGPALLAKNIVDIMYDKNRYRRFFKWHNHYTYYYPKELKDSAGPCRLCAALNSLKRTEITIRNNLTRWWNISSNMCRPLYHKTMLQLDRQIFT